MSTSRRAPSRYVVVGGIFGDYADSQKTDDEIDVALEKTIILFRFLIDKDKFERYYKNHLARRLLYARSASDDAEKGMVAKLKLEM
jgi:cullin 3